MKRKGLALLAVARGRAARRGRGRRREALGDRDQRRRQHVRLAARLDLDAGPRLGVRLHGPVQRRRLRRRHPGDHEPHGRLRRLRRAADARPVHRLQRLRPDPVGARRHGDRRTTSRASTSPKNTNLQSLGRRDREDLHGRDHELERPGDQEAEPEGDAARPEDHAGLPHGQLGHDLQLHRLPRRRSARPGSRSSAPARRSTGRRASGASGSRRRRRRRREHARARSATSTRRSRSRTSCTSRRSRTRPASSSTRASATSRPPAAR